MRPDPVGDHLLLKELTKDPGLLTGTLTLAGEAKVLQAMVVLTDPVRTIRPPQLD